MRKRNSAKAAAPAAAAAAFFFLLGGARAADPQSFKLPEPGSEGGMAVEKAIAVRRTVREYSPDPVRLADLSRILWAAQGITGPAGFRAAPSAGAVYPLELYVAVARVDGLGPGIFKYRPSGHDLAAVSGGDRSSEISEASWRQDWIQESAFIVIFAADFRKTAARYGDRGRGYVYMEAGHAAQNICLEAESLGLGSGLVGAFDDGRIGAIAGLPAGQVPVYMVSVGRKARPAGT